MRLDWLRFGLFDVNALKVFKQVQVGIGSISFCTQSCLTPPHYDKARQGTTALIIKGLRLNFLRCDARRIDGSGFLPDSNTATHAANLDYAGAMAG